MKQSRSCCVLVFALILSLTLPLPMASHAAIRNTYANDDAARVHARLNSPERQAAIIKAAKIDAAARKAFAAQEASTTSGSSAVIPAQASAHLAPLAQKTTLESVLAQRNATRQSIPSASTSPKTLTEVMFNAATVMVGLPGVISNQHTPYDQNANQGLGFHADGTARQADGTTGTNAASAGYNGKRAAAYAGHGLGYNPYGGYQEPGYDPVTGQNFRYANPTNGGRRTISQGQDSTDAYDPTRMLMDRGLNYGLGLANSAAEGLFLGLMESPYGGAKARFNFLMDWDGKINGEGDLLLPWWDSKYTTVYTQLGARSMSGSSSGGANGKSADRWIGNFGLGQRWYPMAINDGTKEDAGNLMLGYNTFFDNDFTRSHQRGGAGIEGQYDWLHLASNYYMPLSGWKGSKDFDSNFIKERPAEGWDVRAKGYLPFYRNVALTGAYTQWYGDNVGMFGASNLEKDPKIWSYGLEYTPVPLVSGFVNQRQSEQGKSDTEFGLRLTYRFQTPWEDQMRHDNVAQLRTVGGSRHEFVDRENKIILEYKAKNNFHVEYADKVGINQFKFRIRNGFDKYVAGQQIRVSASGGVTLAKGPTYSGPAPTTFLAQAKEFLGGLFYINVAHAADFSQTYTTDSNGEFIVRLDSVMSLPVVLTIQAGNNSQSVTLHEATVTGGLTAAAATLTNSGTMQLTFTGHANTAVAWAVVSGPGTVTPASSTTNASGIATATLTGNTTGFGPIEVKATMNNIGYTIRVALDKTLSLTADVSNPVITAGDTKTLKFIVRQNGVALPNSLVTLGISGPGTLSTTSVTTNASGEFSVDLTGNAEATLTITATIASAGSAAATVAVGAATVFTLTPDNPSQTFPVGTMRNTESFSLKENNIPLAAGVAVTLGYTGSGSFNNPPATATTGIGGKIALNLEGVTAGTVTITATAGGKTATCMLTVTPTVFTLTLDNPSQIFLVGTMRNTESFTLKENGTPLAAGVAVTLGYTGSGSFTNPPATATTGIGGKIALNLEGATAGTVTITATAGGKTATCMLTVTPTGLSLTLDNPSQNFLVGTRVNNVAFTLTDNGQLVQNVSMLLQWTGDGAFSAPPTVATVNTSGKFTLPYLIGQTPGNVTLTATLIEGSGSRRLTCHLTVMPAPYVLSFDQSGGYSPAFSGSGSNNKASQQVTITVMQNGSPVGAGVEVSLSSSMNDALNQAIISGRRNQYYGLKVNDTYGGASFPNISPLITNTSGQVTLYMEDFLGERTLNLTASATPPSGSAATASASITFGPGPLAKFKAPLPDEYKWSTDDPITSTTTDFPAAAACGGTVSYTGDGYYASSKLPSQADIRAASPSEGNGAWGYAGWNVRYFWTGELSDDGSTAFALWPSGSTLYISPSYSAAVVCLR